MFALKMLVLVFSFLQAFSLSASDCAPVLSLQASQSVIKEGHQKNQTEVSAVVEMDRLCTQEVRLKVLLKGLTAKVGEHVVGDDINYVTIPAGSAVGYATAFVVGDDEWNEDRSFSFIAIENNIGVIENSVVDIVIKNDDPLINVIYPASVTEAETSQQVQITVKLSEPADQYITGNLEFHEITATRGEDFDAPFQHSFEFFPGETTYTFLANTLTIYTDDVEEESETLYMKFSGMKGATAELDSYVLTIQEQKEESYLINFTSNISITGEEGVAQKMDFMAQLEVKVKEGKTTSPTITPKYQVSMRAQGVPFKIIAHPGSFKISNLEIIDGEVKSADLLFAPAPWEVIPIYAQKLYLYMSTFGHFHQNELIMNPEPVYRLKKVKKQSEGKWVAEYKNRFTSDGGVMVENSTLSINKRQ